MLDAALGLLRDHGPPGVTMTAVAEASGAPSGSLYHAFGSRDVLLAELWLRTIEPFQERFLACLETPDPLEAAEAAAAFTLDWVRAHPDEARLLLLHRREDLASGPWPGSVVERARRLATTFDDALHRYAALLAAVRGERPADALDRAWFVLVDLPSAAVRRHLGDGREPPRAVDTLLRTALRAVVAPTSP